MPHCKQQPFQQLPVDELFRLGIENRLQLKTAKIQESIFGEREKSTRTKRLPNIQKGTNGGVIGQPIIFQKGLSKTNAPRHPELVAEL